MQLGITAYTRGTVLCDNLQEDYTVVMFDVDSNAGVCSGTALHIPRIFDVKKGDRVILEYVVSLNSGLWYGRKPRPGERS